MLTIIHIGALTVIVVLLVICIALRATNDPRYSRKTTAVFALASVLGILDLVHDAGKSIFIPYGVTGLSYVALLFPLLWKSNNA